MYVGDGEWCMFDDLAFGGFCRSTLFLGLLSMHGQVLSQVVGWYREFMLAATLKD